MGIKLSDIKDPALRARIEQADKNTQSARDRQTYTPTSSESSTPKSHENNSRPQRLPHTQPEPPVWRTLVGPEKGTKTGAASADRRVIVRIIGYRVQLCDPDNFAGGVKALLDNIRHATLIPNDRPEDIKLETDQVRVRHKSEQKTVIELEYPE